MDKEPSVSLALVLRHGHDARDVVFLLTEFLFGEVADEVAALAVVDGERVEEERLHVVVERLVIEEKFGQEAKVLAIDLVHVPVHLKDGEIVLAVDLGSGRMPPEALGHVPIQDGTALHVLEAEFAQEQFGQPVQREFVSKEVRVV